MIEIVPAIDIMDGHCVRLTKGEFESRKTYEGSPADLAARYADLGVRRIHLVDLDGAKISSPVNLKTLETVADKVDAEIEWGGGLSDSQAVRDVFSAGATCAIIGSMAVRQPDVMGGWLRQYGPDKIILGADVRGKIIAVKGWQENSDCTINYIVKRFLPDGLTQLICTDIARDGMLEGPSKELYEDLMKSFPTLTLTASGGISCMDDITDLDMMGVPKVIVGKAIYENRITLKEIGQWLQNA